ncbi:MAG TPA: CHAT domain-containing protein [Gemmatimonadales bacterium]|nr:CHAT domain-containing protein [Gemmatimonadales bacterium]
MLQIFMALNLIQAADPRRVVLDAERLLERGSARVASVARPNAMAADPSDRSGLLVAATLARLHDDHAAAAIAYRRILALDSTDRTALYARLGLAESDGVHRSLELAASGFERVAAEAARVRDPSVQAEALIGLALARSRTHPIDSALALLRSAERLIVKSDDALQARLRCVRGPLRVAAGVPGGEEDARLGLASARRAGSRRLQALCWRALGDYMFANVDDPVSAEPYDSAEALQERADDRSGLAETLLASGIDHLSFFKDELAKADFVRARELAVASGSRFAEGWSRLMLGRIVARTGDYPSAAIEYTAAESLLVLVGDRTRLVELRRAQGFAALGLGRLDAAESAMRSAKANADSLGNVLLGFAGQNGVMVTLAARGRWSAAQDAHLELVAFARKHHLEALLPGLRYGRGLIALRLGHLDLAEREFRSYLRPDHAEGAFARYVSRSRLAEVHLERGRVDLAERELVAANAELDSIRAGLSDTALRTFVFQSGSQWEEPDYGLATVVAALARAGKLQPARRLVDQRRARELADRLVRAGPRAARPAPASLPGAGAVQVQLDSTLALVEYAGGLRGQPTTVFLTTRQGIVARVLSPLDSLTPDLARFVALLRAGEPADPLGRRLGAARRDPMLEAIPSSGTRLLIVPDGAVHAIPFDALLLPGGKPLLTRFAVASVPSAAVAADLSARRRAAGPARVLALGDPRFERELASSEDETRESYRSAFEAAGGLARLAASGAEARAAGRFAKGSVVLLRADASEANLKRMPLGQFSVIHFATHALVSDWSPARTALALAPGDGEDGFLGPSEIAGLRLSADLVVLSACRTAGGVVVGGEGLQGLTAPLLEAGARSVVATLWPVRDRQTARLMGSFYASIAGGAPVVEALRSAKLEAYRAGAPSGDWAAFTLVGDPSVRIRLEPAGTAWWPWALGIFAAALLGYGLVTRRRRMGEAA